MKTVHLDLYSDFICPWCYLGKVRLQRIRESLKGELNLDIHFCPYLLYPDMPLEGLPKALFKGKSKPGMGQALKKEAINEKLQLNYKLIDRIPNSIQAHLLISLTPTDQKMLLATHIFRSYFEKGMNIGSKEILKEIATSVEIDPNVLEIFMETTYANSQVEGQIAKNKQMTGVVPTIRLNQIILLPGLQPEEVWMSYIRRAAKMSFDH